MPEKDAPENLAQEKLNFILSLPWVRIFTWLLFFVVLYSVRNFFTVIFLTFIISYIACNVVSGIASLLGRWELFRKLIVVVTYAVFLFVAYSAGRFLAPHIVDQGKGVVNTVSGFVNKGLDKIIPDLVARWRFSRFEGTEEYDRELEALKEKQDLDKLSWDAFKQYARRLRQEFRGAEVKRRGQQALEEVRGTREFEDAFAEYLKERYAAEIGPERLTQLCKEKEAEIEQTLGKEEFRNFKRLKGAGYSDWIQEKVLGEQLARLPQERQQAYREAFEQQFAREKGEEAVAALEASPAAWEEEFKRYYESLTRASPHDYSYERFRKLEQAPDNEAFVTLWGKESAMEQGEKALREKLRRQKLQEFADDVEKRLKSAGIYETMKNVASQILPTLAGWLTSAVNYTFTFALHLILSVFFSFIIVWDIPRLGRGVELLAHSRVKRLYSEIIPDLVTFGNLMGRAFQAQALIAIVNTGLTLLALILLGVANRAFLCTIVFICSFIPVAGVVISTVPIALVGLQMGGILLALKLIGAIIIIHFIEGMILNPKILGDMLHLHPLLVLVVLTVGGHYFGVWGLLLSVPVTVYVIRYVILHGIDPRVLRSLAPKMARAEAAAGGAPGGTSVAAEPPAAPEQGSEEARLGEVPERSRRT